MFLPQISFESSAYTLMKTGGLRLYPVKPFRFSAFARNPDFGRDIKKDVGVGSKDKSRLIVRQCKRVYCFKSLVEMFPLPPVYLICRRCAVKSVGDDRLPFLERRNNYLIHELRARRAEKQKLRFGSYRGVLWGKNDFAERPPERSAPERACGENVAARAKERFYTLNLRILPRPVATFYRDKNAALFLHWFQ